MKFYTEVFIKEIQLSHCLISVETSLSFSMECKRCRNIKENKLIYNEKFWLSLITELKQ